MAHLVDMYSNIHESTSDEPFRWQLRSTPARGVPSMSPYDYNQLNGELQATPQRPYLTYQDNGADATHTEFQEQVEAPETTTPWDWPDDSPSDDSGPLQRLSPFAPNSSPYGRMSFIEWYPKGKARLTFSNDDGMLESIPDLNPWIIEERCPILAAAFERSRSGPQLYLETLTSTTARPFLRFLYTGTYALHGNNGDLYEDVPTSVLLHCQLYRLGDFYALSDLKSQAYVNVMFCATIRFVYQHLRECENIVDAVVNYCVSCLLSHKLSKDEEFKKLAYELRPFHQELCRNSRNRDFENETATAIIQMPFKPYIPKTYASRDDSAFAGIEDVVYHFHSGEDEEMSPRKRKREEAVKQVNKSREFDLPLRPAQAARDAVTDESASENDGLMVVRKRRAPSADSATSPSPGLSLDAGFEVLANPFDEVIVSESASDVETLIEQLPLRTRESAAHAAVAEPVRTDSESEWTLI